MTDSYVGIAGSKATSSRAAGGVDVGEAARRRERGEQRGEREPEREHPGERDRRRAHQRNLRVFWAVAKTVDPPKRTLAL